MIRVEEGRERRDKKTSVTKLTNECVNDKKVCVSILLSYCTKKVRGDKRACKFVKLYF